MGNIFRRFFQVVTKISVNRVVSVLKPKNLQCQIVKFVIIIDGENPMGIKLFHLGSKVPKNKKALLKKGL